ncbi:MAG TPA: hypothetical protein RMH85_01080 [Polyangiaceae bacterium LLY-WYZ-15_(1-7)]|nr:hypothetical protein [Sandaracinus sp.]HJL05350.1 hypothetical protein [Polyangiaceae bacterium LLY-WYZ-15_(1-7)]HJL07055.1 hypothetical protein [Polyangiaceae bacterium LLY-WYZ-15_(1-7)]HJL38241.1 hypothetical protein [Polyangiaceae bacterium LLY-WYZ-15_(1-7)]HJL47294.1 hypothetical protein [Polyangiaceae bacterium LLY-WYZ-15_(1-7)]
MRPPRPILALAATLTALALGCTDLGEYALNEGEVYRGAVLGTRDPDCESGGACSFIRRGFAAETELDLDFVPEGLASNPGTLSTRGEPCAPTFEDEPLLPIAPLAHDALSELDFPGGDRVRNLVYALRPSRGPLAGRDAMAFISLMRDGDVEVRILAGSGTSDCDPEACPALATGQCDFFGVFRLGREEL